MRPLVVLVGPEIEENLSLRYLAASLARAELASIIVPFDDGAQLDLTARAVLDSKPEVVALSLAFQWRALDVLALAVRLRELGFRGHLTAGGHFATFTWRELLRDFREIDSICHHECDETLPALCLAVRNGTPLAHVDGVGRREGSEVAASPPRSPPALEALPWPDRRGASAECLGHGIAAVIGSRGCYANCTFCCIAAFHATALAGPRYRVRPVDDLANELSVLHHEHRRDIFIFHDDDFFVPGERQALARIEALGRALRARGVARFATVVKARPNDLTRPVLTALRDELGCIRLFLGIETDADQGLATLGRGLSSRRNHQAMALLEELGVYGCYNLLMFDPDTTLASLARNIDFLEQHADVPANFGRVELYAGTPLLERMKREGRCRGDYLGWDYSLASPEVGRVFDLAMRCFRQRNFAAGALANRLQGTRFDVEVARFFHPGVYRAEWLDAARGLSRSLAHSSAAALRGIVSFVESAAPASADGELVRGLSEELRAGEAELGMGAAALEQTVQTAVGARCQHARPRHGHLNTPA